MKKALTILAFVLLVLGANSQNCYWVMLTDKAGTTFDPYSYFDSKAIERYQLNDADLYDISNYPLNDSYVEQVNALATEEVGQSRWLNAAAVMATPEQIEAIQKLPFVKEVVMLESNMQLVSFKSSDMPKEAEMSVRSNISEQLIRMGGRHFRAKGIDGKGVRIAVFDGGFPQVNTHIAFKHLRDNHQIIKTWNFPNKKENVYGWNSHGLMTLSCIAGIHRYPGTEGEVLCDDGLATGAEFLLARTEVEAEPFKEEVWWQMAVEWADQNGAQIISSSLGYGKDRYYTKDMNGQSYVAKAGNMAARKGILVCNSAGNEGDDRSWLTIITPADADSVLCVGGIINKLDEYNHISFSSYGPSADGRQKPNVVAFGRAHTANTGNSNKDYHYVDGTSFSCPLVAGFAACALQTNPKMKAMELFHEIERSADLYPYCDYAYGYGVPQADYFTGDRKATKPTFKFVKDDQGYLNVYPLEKLGKCHLFVKNAKNNGEIIEYNKYDLDEFDTNTCLRIIYGQNITVNLNGYTESYKMRSIDDESYSSSADGILDDRSLTMLFVDKEGNLVNNWPNSYQLNGPYKYYLNEKKYHLEPYFMLGLPINTDGQEIDHSFWSPAKRIGIRRTHYFTKAYGWGMGLEYGHISYRFGSSAASNDLENMLGVNAIVDGADEIYKRRVSTNQLSLEIYQRVRIFPAGLMHKGMHWDLGAYISLSGNKYRLKYSNNTDLMADSRDLRMTNVNPLRGESLQYGVTTRLTYDIIGIYGRYNLHRLGKTLANDEVQLPALEVGLQIAF